MTQRLQINVIHGATECPVLEREKLEAVIGNLEQLTETVTGLSDGKIQIVADWYNRNEHVFHYLVDVRDLRPAEAEDVLKQAIGLKEVTVTSYPTESGEQALAVLKQKLAA